ncbi:DNA topoisomerase [Emericellopsis atlantica]|uniref:DNA topoisomerase n=1 Tax=Emericellopsis atlantica TaxID=2614577 RepID=A0A9P8CSE8_9HYPO|nr:DNA topoisomerase [Emericellopsis atlantica]KAG9257277.1 DNA topoisomerase [Emericellopsis atlantica]
MKVLCVAEKPSISKAVATHLSGGSFQTHNTRSQYIKNYAFTFDFGQPWGQCDVTMTAVVGHLTQTLFADGYKNWESPPPVSLFGAPTITTVHDDKKAIAKNIADQARYARLLVIWTDCDLEGEYIGHEIVEAAKFGNRDITVKRATFSNIERAHVLNAARRLGNLDAKLVNAVAARIELDLRVGWAFTRFITNSLRPLGGPVESLMISYGSCQFPTLGFVVDRYFKVRNFTPEPFWSIKVMHKKDGKQANFSWARNRVFDRMSAVILYERCLDSNKAKVTKVQEKATRKFKPLPLTTVELQKAATRLLRMTGQQALNLAEGLYNKGFVSYPRTETDRFDKGMDLKKLVEKQTPDQRWGPHAQGLVQGGFRQPREGRHDDKAHPPIHPITYASPSVLSPDEARIYEYIVRRFLACCSEDAKGMATDIELQYGEEIFTAHGVVVLERNYLEVFIYDKWEDSAELPNLRVGEQFEPTEALLTEGKTSPPNYLTEADLLALMDANGIGTDATMAEHIQKIQDREYVQTTERSGQAANDDDDDDDPHDAPVARGTRGRGRARVARGGRGGRTSGQAAGGGRRGIKVFVPTRLGVALILGFDRMNFETSLGKPFLRKQMETKMKAICAGQTTKDVVLRESVAQYRQVFLQSQEKLNVLKAACREFVFAG